MAHAVGVGESQLGAGVRPFFADDQPHPVRPAVQHHVPGEFGHPCPVTDFAVRLDGWRPGRGWYFQDGLMGGVGDGHADRVRQPLATLREPGDELVGAATGVGADQRLPPPPVLPRELSQGDAGGSPAWPARSLWSAPSIRRSSGRTRAPSLGNTRHLSVHLAADLGECSLVASWE